jgi:hypothetical protein
MSAPDSIQQLVQRFDEHRLSYLSGKYNEAQLRQEFLNPLFEALGWDVFNKQGYAEPYKDVIHEASLEVEGAAKAPDYAFRVGGTRKFFVEAKKPAVNIQYDIVPAFQLRRYAWSARLPLSILTDFEEFAVYESRSKPDKSDSAATGRVLLLNYKDYVSKWDELAAIFSRDAVLKGSFDKYAQGLKGKQGTTEVDDAFLQEIECWRDLLARNLALRNPDLQVRELNYAVQMTIDRIVFLRICEDRGIEREDQLQELLAGEDIYARLCLLFRQADSRYNSGLFHFGTEQSQSSAPDDLTLRLAVDDKVLKEILSGLYYPAPYVFREIPADILGQVYERFLGKVIRLTAGHQAKVEEKPEVRKAGGVYYTPTYIVDYIVRKTVGRLLKGKTPSQAAALKILDPACGSGSFLLGAYQYLLDWHVDWYSKHTPGTWAAAKTPAIYQVQGGGWKLTTTEKKKILLNNIHGVDIDPQAVEVTKLSLSLKVLEGESQESIGAQLGLFKERALPDLGRNIQCGNSLIGPDYFEGRMFPDEEERYRVNAFNWQAAFPQVFIAGGFDIVIGNPPYIRMETFKELKDYLKSNYVCHDERSDIYAYFIERAHKALKVGGLFGMIVSNKFLRANYGKPLRDFIQQNAGVIRIVDFAGLPVFKGATVRTIIFLSSHKRQNEVLLYSSPLSMDVFSQVEAHMISVDDAISGITFEVSSDALKKDPWSFAKQNADDLLSRLKKETTPLSEYCNGLICMGIKSGMTEAFVIDAEIRKKILKINPKAETIIKPFINGRDIRRYALEPKNVFLIYTYHGINISDYPGVETYLKPFKEQLIRRATKQEWYELQQPQYAYENYFSKPKIVFPDIAITPRFVLDENGFYGSNTMYFIAKHDLYLLGLLNSKLAYFYFRTVCAGLEGKNVTYLRFFGQYLEGFPIMKPEKAAHDNMVSLVERMLALHKQSPRTLPPTEAASSRHQLDRRPETPQEKEMLQREIESTDHEIDALVYQLYGLTEAEIKIVEGN